MSETAQSSSSPATPPMTGALSESQFRELYVANMRKKFEELKQRQAMGLPANAAARPPPQEPAAQYPLFPQPPPEQQAQVDDPNVADVGNQWWRTIRGLIEVQHIMNHVVQVALAAFVISRGEDLQSFCWALGGLCLLKLVTTLFSRLRLQRHRLEHENDVRPEGERRMLHGRRKFVYVVVKSISTFFVSMYPSFRVEALEVELRMDGIDHNAPPPAAAAPPVAPAAEANQ